MGVSTTKRQPHFMMGSSCSNFLNVLKYYGGCSPSRLAKTLAIIGAAAATSPLRGYASLRHAHRVGRIELHPEPLFIIGHWQSGHSPLHMLFSQDRQFGYLDTVQATCPWSYRQSSGFSRRLLARSLRGKDRGCDSIPLSADLPQGSDLPMALACKFSAYFAYVFPQRAAEVFEKGVLFDRLSDRELLRWKKDYHYQMKKIVDVQGKPRLVIRNASDTGRIPHLLSMFPRARFIHVIRNPYSVIQATNERWESLCRILALQTYDLNALRGQSIEFYERLMKRYLRDRELIPAENLVEVRYEDLENDPIGTMRQVYLELGLTGFDAALPAFQRHIDSLTGSLGGQDVNLLDSECKIIRNDLEFAFREFGYDVNTIIGRSETNSVLI